MERETGRERGKGGMREAGMGQRWEEREKRKTIGKRECGDRQGKRNI